MRDQASNLTIRPVIAPAANNDLGTTPLVGTVIDRLGRRERGGLVRAGCAAYTTEAEIDRLVAGVAAVARA